MPHKKIPLKPNGLHLSQACGCSELPKANLPHFSPWEEEGDTLFPLPLNFCMFYVKRKGHGKEDRGRQIS